MTMHFPVLVHVPQLTVAGLNNVDI